MNSLIALTGATGLVGSYTAAALHRAGHRVRALVRPTARRDHIAGYITEWQTGEMHDPQSLAGLVAGVDAVIHAGVDWDALEESPIRHFEKNVMGSLRLLEAARLAEVGQFLFIASGAVYAEILPGRPLDETHPTWPNHIYGAYKAAIEPFLKAYHQDFGMNTSSWRPTAIYGVDPKLHESQWFDLVKKAKDGGVISTGHGGKIVHVQDIADALTYAIDDQSTAGQFYNLVDSYMYWQQAAEIAKELTGATATIEDQKGSGPKNQFDTKKAVEFFNRHGNSVALRRGLGGVRDYVQALLTKL